VEVTSQSSLDHGLGQVDRIRGIVVEHEGLVYAEGVGLETLMDRNLQSQQSVYRCSMIPKSFARTWWRRLNWCIILAGLRR
jgi:hypothetical protein